MITSTSNQRIKEVRKLLQRRQREATGRLLLEGVRLISDACQSQAALELVFYAPELTTTNPTADTLLRTIATQVECLPCSRAVFASLVETVTPQGIAAVVALPNLPLPAQRTFTLLLDQVRDPGNAGTLLRSAEAAGVELVIFAPDTVDPFNDKVVRAGMGAHFRLPLRSCDDWSAVQALLPLAAPCYLATADAPLTYDAVDWQESSVLIIGGEADGASAMARTLAQPINIPMLGKVESLNAAVAGAVILFEAARQRRQAPPAPGH